MKFIKRERAYAKINLGLDVIRKREDSYHEVEMLMQTVDIYDELEFFLLDEDKILVELSFFDDSSINLSLIKEDKGLFQENNIVYKAAKLIKDEFNIRKGIFIKVIKSIPIAAGMAGGSTDAATTLLALNEIFSLNLSKDKLRSLSLKLGADVPYFVEKGTVLAKGIGEKLERLKDLPKLDIVIVKPDISVSTKEVYENLKPNIENRPNIKELVFAVETSDVYKLCKNIKNVMEVYTLNTYPIVREIKNTIVKEKAICACMSGSGPTVFGIFNNKEEAFNCYNKFKVGEYKNLAKQVYLTNTININGGKYD